MNKIEDIIKMADVVVNGYAFTRNGNYIRVLNIEKTNCAAVIDSNDEVIETSMSDIELDIVLMYYYRNRKFMEESDAEILSI